jgi:uncharacterized protein (DUF433 family)
MICSFWLCVEACQEEYVGIPIFITSALHHGSVQSYHAHIHHGVPCIKGTRVPVSVLVGSLADGDSINDLLAAYPHLTEADIHAALKFAAEAVNNTDFIPLVIRG